MTKVYEDIDELIEAITEEWDKIPLKMINNLIDGHLGRVQEVLHAEGEFPAS